MYIIKVHTDKAATSAAFFMYSKSDLWRILMFQNPRYLTRGVQEVILLELQLLMWDALEAVPEPKDYFQVFRLSSVDGIQRIEHKQEQPPYKREYLLPTVENPITAKVYIIDDGDHSTMLLAEEY